MKKISSVTFDVITEEGRTVQKCPQCNYMSPSITNNKPFEISNGLKLHLMKSHNYIKESKNANKAGTIKDKSSKKKL